MSDPIVLSFLIFLIMALFILQQQNIYKKISRYDSNLRITSHQLREFKKEFPEEGAE